ncbi:Glyoxalase/Bleomycin resistance protein/Dihydroxybiphenyl dioxygenase [Haematococcus lacustris]
MTEVCAYPPRRGPLPLRAINHISHLCKDVAKTAEWYSSLLGFSMIKRPASFDFDGAWLYGYGVGLHLIAGHPPHASRDVINPKADHLSFACECGLEEVEALLKYRNIEYKKAHVEEGGILVTQLFMHDPDGNMVELCNCDLLPVRCSIV